MNCGIRQRPGEERQRTPLWGSSRRSLLLVALLFVISMVVRSGTVIATLEAADPRQMLNPGRFYQLFADPSPGVGPPVAGVPGTWYGVARAPQQDWPTIRQNVRGSVVELIVYPYTPARDVVAALDMAQTLEYRVLFHIYDANTNTRVPWDWDGTQWTISVHGIEVLELVEDHPAMWALYCLEEPFDYTSESHMSADAQRAMYTFLRQYTDLPLYSEMGSITRAEQEGIELSDGMCDKCCVAPTNWNRGLGDSIDRADAEYDTWQRAMSTAELIYMVNTYDAEGQRTPTKEELGAFRDHACSLGVPIVYYPWYHDLYDATLEDAPELWPVIAEHCETPIDSRIIVDHNAVDASVIPQAWLDEARDLSTFFCHKSIGKNILDGISDLQRQDPDRYSIDIQYSHGPAQGINEYQAGSNGAPLTKIEGFAPLVKDGHNLAMMKFCVGDFQPFSSYAADEIWFAYRDTMIAEQAQHPNVTLVWWTSPLTTQADGRGLQSFAEFNTYVRDYVNLNGGVLFDIADIQSHDPRGNPISLDSYEAMYNGYSDDGAHLNEMGRQRVASAMWSLLGRVAGWRDRPEWISIVPAVDLVSICAGETATYALSLTASDGFSQALTLNLQGAPSGATVSFNQNPVTPPATSQLLVSTTTSIPPGTYPLTATASAGQVTATTRLTLTLSPVTLDLVAQPPVHTVLPGDTAAYTLSVTGSEGLSEPVTLALQGAPPESTTAFNPNPFTPPATSQLYVTATASAVAGTYPMTVTGSSGVLTNTVRLTLLVAAATPSFTLSISPTTRVAEPNHVAYYTAFITGINGFSQPVSLTIAGLPTDVGAAWSVNPVIPDNASVLTLSIPSDQPFGDYPLQVVGIAGTQVVTKDIRLAIAYPFEIYLPTILREPPDRTTLESRGGLNDRRGPDQRLCRRQLPIH